MPTRDEGEGEEKSRKWGKRGNERESEVYVSVYIYVYVCLCIDACMSVY